MLRPQGLMEFLEAAKVLPDPGVVDARVTRMRERNPDAAPEVLARQVVNGVIARCTGIGVVAGLPAAVPGFGTAVQLGANVAVTTGEFGILMRNVTSMQLTIAGIYGHDVFHEDRREELLIIAGLQAGAVVPAREAGKRVGTKVAVGQFNKRVSGAALRKLNQKLGATVFTKYGTRRGGVALGRMLPFGVGAAIGGSVNLLVTKSYGAAMLHYYGKIVPDNEPLFVPE